MLSTINTLHNFCIYRYSELKHYQGLCLSLFKIVLIPGVVRLRPK